VNDIYYEPYNFTSIAMRDQFYWGKYEEIKAINIAAATAVVERMPWYSQPKQMCISEQADKHAMMWPDEFEYVSKTLINVAPKTYLEWGTGKSAMWFPALAEHAYIIDNYLPWCAQVL
jgi:hypothetical protein